MEAKHWWQSALVWLGVIVTAQGLIPIIVDFLNKGTFQATDILLLISGSLVVIRRIWFTNTVLTA